MTNVKKDKLKIFSIFAGISILILAVVEVIKMAADFIAPVIIAKLSGVEYYFGSDVATLISLLDGCLVPICFIAFAVAAAILLFTNKNSVVSLIPMGMLTFVFFQIPLKLVLDTVIAFLMPGAMLSLANLFVSVICLVLSLICAAIFTAIVCIAGCTFLKKRRFILMLILAIFYIVGGIISAVVSGGSAAITFVNLIFTNLPAQNIITKFYASLISPIIVAIMRICLPIPAILATVGMISKPADAAE